MAGKALLNVYSLQVKNDLLSIFIQNGYDVLEAFNIDELTFKYGLIKDQLDVYVHELDEVNYDLSLQQLRRIDREKVRCILLIHKYDSKMIDAALALDVKDVVVLPIEREKLKSKVLVPAYKVGTVPVMPKAPMPKTIDEGAEEVVFDLALLKLEVSRAIRGDYPLSIVMVTYAEISSLAYEIFELKLKALLRATDEIMVYKKNTLLLLCPFTPKDHVIDVENKVKEAYAEINKKGIISGNVYISGTTYPDDGADIDVLLKRMKENIYDSRLFGELDGPLSKFNRDEVRNRLRRYF